MLVEGKELLIPLKREQSPSTDQMKTVRGKKRILKIIVKHFQRLFAGQARTVTSQQWSGEAGACAKVVDARTDESGQSGDADHVKFGDIGAQKQPCKAQILR